MSSVYIVVVVAFIAAIAVYWQFPNQVSRLLIIAGRRLARTRARSVSVDGLRWPYLDGGPPDAPVILLVHGFGADKDTWLLYAGAFTRRYRVVAPDLPGFGEGTRNPDLRYSAAAQARRLHDFVAALGLDGFHLAGISMGGYISALYALEHPEQVSSLVMFDNAGIQTDARSPLRDLVDAGDNPLTVRTTEDLEAMIELITHRPPWIPGAFKRYFLRRCMADADLHDRIFWGLAGEIEEHPLNDRLAALTMPTLIIWGRNDKLFPASVVEVMTAGIPDSKAVVLDKTGHAPTIERPRLTAKHHLEFLGALAGPVHPGKRGQTWN